MLRVRRRRPAGSRRLAALATVGAALVIAAGALDRSLASPARGQRVAPRSSGPHAYSCPILPADNPLNQDISRAPVDPRSASYVASIGASLHLHADFGSNPSYGIPFAVVGARQPRVPIRFTEFGEQSDPGPYPVPANAPVEGAGEEGDRHVLVLQGGACKLYELYHARRHGPGWEAGSGAVFNLRSNALRPEGWTSADAAGLPIFPGLVRWDEVQAGAIKHAIRFTAQQSDRSFLWPARHQAGTAANTSLPPMGARFRLKSTYDISHFSAQAQVILLAMQHYGLILADNGSNWFFSGTEDAAWPDSLLSELKTIPASQFDAIDESSLMLDANSATARVCDAGTGGGPAVPAHWRARTATVPCSFPWLSRKGSGGWPALRSLPPQAPPSPTRSRP